ncbi:MAG: beta strand repeat-containing protein [Verrucomicrobiaceae bacterium]
MTAGTVNLAKTGTFLAVGETTNASGIPYAALIVNNGATARITGAGTDQIGNASSVVVQGTGVFDVNGSGSTSTAESFDGLAGSGLVRNLGANAFTLTLGANNSSGISAYTVGAAQAAALVGDNNINARGLNHFAGVIQDNIALTKIGSGTQILSGLNTYTGLTTISAGTLKLGVANALPNGSGRSNVQIIGTNAGVNVGDSASILAPGTLDIGGFNQAINGLDSTTGGFVTNNPTAGANITNTLTVGSGNATGAFNGVIMNGYAVGANSTTATPLAYVGTIKFTKTGSGTQVLSGANTYSGKTTIENGALSVASINSVTSGSATSNLGAPTTVGNGTIDFGAGITTGRLLYTGTGETTDRVVNLAGTTGGGIIDQSGTGVLKFTSNTTATGVGSKTLTLQGDTAGTGEMSGNIVDGSGTSALTKAGTGTWVLSGNSTYTGKTTIENGALSVASINSVTSGSATSNLGAPTTVGNGTIDFGAGITTGRLLYTGTGETTDRVVNLAGTTGGGIIDQSGTGVLKFTSNTTATGVGSKTLTLQGDTAGTGEMSGNIVDGSGTSALTKAGTGTWVLTGNNSYDGTTTVSAGTLLINGNQSTANGAVGVTGATLGGNGTIGGAVSVNAGGILAPGSAEATAGTLTLTSSLTMAGNASPETRLSFDFTNATGNAGGEVLLVGNWWSTYSGTLLTGNGTQANDLINLTATTGSPTLTWNTGGKVTLNQLGTTYNWVLGDVLNLLDWTNAYNGGSAISGTFNPATDFDLPTLGSGLSWDTTRFMATGAIAVTPEPSRALLLMLGLLGLFFRRRRSR